MLDLSPLNLLHDTSLPFRDARGCKEWLAGLPLVNVAPAHAALSHAIDSLNLTDLPGYERLKIVALLRDKVAYVQEAMAHSYAGKPLPMTNQVLDVWENAAGLWQGMEQGYRTCLRAAANEDRETAKYFALIVQSRPGLGARSGVLAGAAPLRLTASTGRLLAAPAPASRNRVAAASRLALRKNPAVSFCPSTYLRSRPPAGGGTNAEIKQSSVTWPITRSPFMAAPAPSAAPR